ncbi:NAD(P)H-dependent flavin oxidoreductase [Nakamurella leprariae]|uniref:Propionate 3-nitronate monooxygenase n=1 Tax=Nakamurella leprariae TaxID=2803911 RepID=A0A938YD45_9ACTN|nr:nitronate monooxygenase [Nakamurella leprariae]MBM9465989.1 nitronate monooxygenase [Nakamurella leprariae]
MATTGRPRLSATGVLAGLGVGVPLLAAPMAGGASTPDLVAAAAAAGGLGFLAAGYLSTAALAAQIGETRSRADRFGVNLFVPNPVPVSREVYDRYAATLRPVAAAHGVELPTGPPREDEDEWVEKVALLCADPVPVVSFTFGVPEAAVVRAVRAAGSITAQTVTTTDEARAAAAAGVDVLIAQAAGAGGHSATTTPTIPPTVPPADVPLPHLIRRIAAASRLPVWATGGLSRPEHVRAALDAGAEAVAVGTVLLRSPESGASAVHRAALADPDRTATVLTTAFSGRPARALRNEFTDRFTEGAPLGYPAIHHLTGPLRRAATAAGDPEAVHLWAGLGWRDATDRPAAEILQRLVS